MEILAVLEEQLVILLFFFQAEDGIRDVAVTGVQTCALPILSSVCAAVPPIARITLGFTMSIWRNRYGTHAAISSNCGRRFSGGRHLTTLQMKTRSRGSSIAPRILVSSSQAGPTDGLPA